MGYLSPLPQPPRSIHPLIYSLLAGVAGFAINGLPLTFYGDTSMVFGGSAALVVALAQGPWWGLLSAAIASARTLTEWGHPLGLLTFSAEAAAIGWLCGPRTARAARGPSLLVCSRLPARARLRNVVPLRALSGLPGHCSHAAGEWPAGDARRLCDY
jgi:hypothetical protein